MRTRRIGSLMAVAVLLAGVGMVSAGVRRLAKIICPFLLSMCYDRLYAEPNKRGHCSKVYHLEATLG